MNNYVRRIDQLLKEFNDEDDALVLRYLRTKFEDKSIMEKGYVFIPNIFEKGTAKRLCKQINAELLVVQHNDSLLISGF